MIDYPLLAKELRYKIGRFDDDATVDAKIEAALRSVAEQQREQDAQITESLQIPGHSVAGPQIAAIAEAIRFVR